MDDHTPAGNCRHEGWRAGQEVALRAGALAGLSGSLVRCAGNGRWMVRLAGLEPGVLLVVKVAALKRLSESSSSGAEVKPPPVHTMADRITFCPRLLADWMTVQSFFGI